MPRPDFRSRPLYDNDSPSPKVEVYRPQRFDHTQRKRNGYAIKGRIGHVLTFVWRGLKPFVSKESTDGGRRISVPRTLGSLCVVMIVIFGVLWITLPNIDDPQTLFASQSTVILDRNGTELYRLFSSQDRTYMAGDQINDYIKKATISIEDERFFDRGCVDVIGFTRALLSQVLPGVFVRSGGSTLTQQFAGNALVGRQRSILRKIRELMLSCKLEQHYNKDQLLELYLNWIPYGQNAYGIEQAARSYFGVHAKDVSLAQAAVLAALPQRPTYFNPYGKHLYTQVTDAVIQKIISGQITQKSQIAGQDITIGLIGHAAGTGSTTIYIGGRTDQVLKNCLDQHRISQEEYEKALKDLQTLTFQSNRKSIRAPHFVLWIEKQVESLLGISEETLTQGGFRITTTLDWNIQQIAEKVVTKHKDDVLKRFGAHNAALLSVLPDTKEVVAYVGNADYADDVHEGRIDMVRAPRQPGSSFKPIVYATAFEAGYGPGTVVYDIPTKFGDATPQNYGGDFWGLLTMRTALAGSRNIPAIKAFFLAGGEEKVLAMAERLGITTPSKDRALRRAQDSTYEYGYPLAIGSAEVPLYEMVQAYATLADGGQFAPLTTILKITDRDGNILPVAKPKQPVQVLDARIAAELTSILSDATSRPNDYWKSILSVPGFSAAAKTGTSNKCLEFDAKKNCTKRKPESTWTMGYTPSLLTGVWVGNATSQSLFDKADGLTTAAPLWNDFMREAVKKTAIQKTSFDMPGGMTQPLISRLSGDLASACTPVELRKPDIFLQENTPTKDDTACVLMKVDKVTGLLSSPACPADAVEERPFFLPTSEAPTRWTSWEQAVQDWAKAQMAKWDANPLAHSGSQLPLPLAPTQQCDPSLTPGRLNKPSVTIVAPYGGAAVSYPAFKPQLQIRSVSAIKQVDYFVDDKPIRTVTSAPFTLSLRVPKSIEKAGSHTLKVIVTDAYFNTATDTSSFQFSDIIQGPSVSITSPTGGQEIIRGSALTIQAQASGDIQWVDFYIDNLLLTTKPSEPYTLTYPLDVPSGAHTVRVIARDTGGAESEDDVQIMVTDDASASSK